MAAKKKLFGKPYSSVVKRPGAFKAKAQAAGDTTSGYASKVLAPDSKADPRTKKQAALAKTFAKMRGKKQ